MNEEPLRLQNAQRAIRDAYFDNDTGLYTLDCVPGAGKSTVRDDISAEDILRRYVAGDSTPEQRVAVISFTRSEAETIVPDICDRLREIVDHELIPAACHVTDEEVAYLCQRIRQAPCIGTIDSILRDVLGEIATDIGFDEMPVIGNKARQQQLYTACYNRLQADPDIAHRLARLEQAYPEAEYEDGVSEMLANAVTYCRNQRLSMDAFRATLVATVDDVYAEGSPQSFSDLVGVIEQYVGDDELPYSYDDLDDGDKEAICAADERLQQAWRARIGDFCAVLDVYRQMYRQLIRDRGVVSHTDVAYLIDAYFSDRLDNTDPTHRSRIRQRYHTRIGSLIIDEAQDVSAIQHAALSQLVTPETRVFCAGDLLQSIYRWRHADPTLFETATDSGEYLGIDWDTHEHRTATTTYRCRPDIASAINVICEPALTDPARGNLGELEIQYPGLDATRDPTDKASVHIGSFDPPNSYPNSDNWVSPDDGAGEADILATMLAAGRADGTFTDADGDPLGITVLFRWSSKMETYDEVFENAGLSVRNASDPLFGCSVVSAVLDVCAWLIAPAAPERTKTLVVDSPLGLDTLEADFESHEWDLDAVLKHGDLSTAHQQLLQSLIDLRDRREQCFSQPAGVYIEEIIETLALRADPHDRFENDPDQRVANLDTLIETLTEWEGDEYLTPHELTKLVAPFREDPRTGPSQPSIGTPSHDVEFRTIHDCKGDEDDIIVLANPGFNLWSLGPQTERLLTQGGVGGLAPPTNIELPDDVDLPPFSNGLYDPDSEWDRDVGLRWASNHWRDAVTGAADGHSLVGPNRLEGIVANERAEAWRLLYVALTRAREHLVVPLPRSVPGPARPRDRWLDTIRDGLNFTGGTETYTPDPATRSNNYAFEIGVNDVNPYATDGASGSSATIAHSDVAVVPPRRNDLAPWVPRFINPSTMYALTDDPEGHARDHLLDNALHTATNEIPDDLRLPFDQLGPDDIGTCLHDVLTTLVDRDMTTETLRACGDAVRGVFEAVVDDHAPHLNRDDREMLFRFFNTEILPAFLDSALWSRIQQAETVTVEHPVDGLVTVDDIKIELHGTADFVVELPSGERYVTDVKITLTKQTAETRRRYDLQVAAYAYLFGQQDRSTSVQQSVEAFGVDRTTVQESSSPSTIEDRLQLLLQG
jgi:ATP-dependent helicase/nuclease subunit A